MKKLSLIAVLSVLLTLSFIGPAFADDSDTVEQDVTVTARYSLERTNGGTSDKVEFTEESDYENYAQTDKAVKLKVKAPGSWDVGAKVKGDSADQGITNAFHAKAAGSSQGWVDLGDNHNTIKSGDTGVTNFWVHYRVYADQLSPDGDDINHQVTVEYAFL